MPGHRTVFTAGRTGRAAGERRAAGPADGADPGRQPPDAAKIELGDRLFHEKRFSADGKVSCATCHEEDKAFTDHRRVSEGHNGLLGTRNAPTVINAAYMKTLFWDGREPDLEGQSKQPPVNPVEGGLPDHEALLEIIRDDPSYVKAFKEVFGVDAADITIDHYAEAIASFRTHADCRRLALRPLPVRRRQDGHERGGHARPRGVYAARAAACPAIGSSRTRRCSPTTASTTSASASRTSRAGRSEIAAEFLKAKNAGRGRRQDGARPTRMPRNWGASR